MADTVLGIRITADNSGLIKGVNDSTGALDRMGKSSEGVSAAAVKLNNATTSLTSSFAGLSRVAGMIGFGMLARESIALADGYTKLTSQLKNATNSAAEYAKAMADVNRISAGAQADIAATSQLYGKLNLALSQTGVSQSQVAKITETVSLGLKVNGASTAEAASAMLQLSQAFGSGVLRGEEFNAVAESAPNLLRALASSMGVPYGELRNLASQGAITSEILANAFSDPALLASYQGQAKSMQTISGSMTVLGNNVMQTVGALMQQSGAVTGVSSVITSLSDGVNVLSKNMWLVTAGAQGMTAAVGLFVAARSAVAIYEYVAATVAAKNAAVAAAEAAVLQARANYMAGGAGVAAAQSALAQATANATLTGSLISAKNAMIAFVASNPITAITAALAIGVTAWVAWGNSAKDNAEKAISAAKGSAAAMRENGIAQLEIINASLRHKADMLDATAKGGGVGRGSALEEQRLIVAEIAANNHAIFKLQKDAEKNTQAHDLATTAAWNKLALTEKQQHAAKIEELNRTYLEQIKVQGITQAQALKLADEYNVKLAEINSKAAKKTPADKAKTNPVNEELKRYTELIQSSNDRIAALAAEALGTDKLSASEKHLAIFEAQRLDGKTGLTEKHIESVHVKLQEVVAVEQLALAHAAELKAREEMLKGLESETAGIKKQIEAAQYETSIIGKTKEEIALLQSVRADHTITVMEERLAVLDAAGARTAESQALRDQIKVRRELKSVLENKAAQIATRAAVDLEKKANIEMWKTIESTAHDTWNKVWQGGNDAFTNIGKTIKSAVLDLLYQMTLKKWIIGVTATATGGTAGAMDMLGGGSGGVGSLVQAGQTIWNAFSGGMASGLGSMAMSAGTALGSAALTEFGVGAAYAGGGGTIAGAFAGSTAAGIGATVATAIPYLAAAYAAYSVISGLTAGGGGKNYHRGGTNAQFDANGKMLDSAGQVVGYGPGSVAQSAESINAVTQMQKSYAGITGTLGVSANQTSFGYNTAYADSVGVRGGISSGVNGKAVYTNANMSEAEMQLAASRAVFAAVQSSEMPAYLAKVFNGVTAGTATLDQINNTYALAQSVKFLHDQLSETRTPLEISRTNMLSMAETLHSSMATYKQDFLAAIDAGISADVLAQWQNFGALIASTTQLEADKLQADQQMAKITFNSLATQALGLNHNVANVAPKGISLVKAVAASLPAATAAQAGVAAPATGGGWSGLLKQFVPGFASGGQHSGGWRVVGERGPELEYTGPASIVNHRDSKSLFDLTPLLAEIAALRAELRAGQVTIAQNTGDTSKTLRRWNGDGLPEVRVLA